MSKFPKDSRVSARVPSSIKKKIDESKYNYGEVFEIGANEITNPKIVKYVLLKLNDPSVSNLNGFENDWKNTLLGEINNFFDSSAGLTLELNGKTAEAKIKYNIINSTQNEAGEQIEKSEP